MLRARHLRCLLSVPSAPAPFRAPPAAKAASGSIAAPLLALRQNTSSSSAAAFSSAARERFASSFARQRYQQEDASDGDFNDDQDQAADTQPLRVNRIAVIGGGNMADAVVTGVLSKALLPLQKLVISDPNPEKREKYQSRGIPTSDRNVAAVKDADVIIMAVKPQVLNDYKEQVMMSFRDAMRPDALVISVVAGATIEAMQSVLGDATHVIRTMPNTPAMIGEGMTVWSQSSEVTEEQHALVSGLTELLPCQTKRILGAFGIEVFVDDESALDMATALSGSGPAYFFLVAEAMIDAGVHMGFSRAVATKLVQQTMLGSALYMQSSGVHPVVLRNNITSPGGTTAAAMYRAEKNGFRAVIADSIWAAYERCVELGSPTPVQRKRPRA